MPQMSPLNWLNLMMTFMMTMMIFNSLNYFMLTYKFKKFNNLTKSMLKWKW